MVVLIPVIVIVPLILFWGRMYQDMTNNQYLTGAERFNWMLAFVFLNVFGAIWYYSTEYRYRH